MSVVLPAPFSPRSASTSPGYSCKSTWSLATSPPKRLTMPRASRTGVSAADIGDSVGGWRRCTADRPGDNHDRQDIRQQADDLERDIDALQLHGRRDCFGDAEQQRRAPGAKGRPLAED